MLGLHGFAEKMKSEIQLLCRDSYEIFIENVQENNGEEQTALRIKNKDWKEAVYLYLDSYYEQYLRGMAFEELKQDIWDVFNTFEGQKMVKDCALCPLSGFSSCV